MGVDLSGLRDRQYAAPVHFYLPPIWGYASLRYLDTFAKIDGSWYFAERKLLLDWSETRPSTAGI